MFENELMSLAILFLFVAVGGIISARAKQPIGIGLLLVGAVIGPNALNLVKDQGMINMMIDFGAILLLFVIGLEFAISKLIKIGAKSLMFGLLKTGVVFFITFEVLFLMGVGVMTSIFLGVILSFSSTVVIVKILESKGLYQREELPLLVGVLFIEDILAVIILTFLSKAGENIGFFPIIENIFIAMSIMAITYIIMLKLASPVISWFIKNSKEDIVPFIALGMCAAFSYVAYILGLSPATGAFLAGSIVASCPHVTLFKHSIKPYTETFTSLFFISIGTIVNFSSLKPLIPLISIIFLLILVTRFIAVGFISSLITNFNKEQVIFSSIAMMAISEFSLLIAQSASKLGITIDLVSLTAFIIFVTSLVMSFSVSHYSRVSTLIDNSHVPKDWADKPKSLSRYINMLLHELDNENANTKSFHKLLLNSGISILSILFVIVLWSKLTYLFIDVPAAFYFIHAAAASLAVYLIYCFYVNTRKMYHILVIILSNNNYYNLNRSRRILKRLLVVVPLFLSAIFSPLIIAGFNLPLWTNFVPLIILSFVAFKLMRMVRSIDDFTSRRNIFPSYKKSEKFTGRVQLNEE